MLFKLPAAGAFAMAMALGLQAHATVYNFSFNGSGISGSGVFTVAPNVSPPDPNPLCGTPGNNACRSDPAGAFKITGITGTFSDPAIGVSNAAITGLVPISPSNERDATFDPLVPTSLSFIDYAPGEYLTYNNLFFPNGSPIDCDFPFTGTFVDVFGTAFTVAGGYTVDLWGDGDMNGPGTTTYGIGVVQGANLLAYQFSGLNAAIPEPSTWSLVLLGVGALGYGLRRRRRHGLAAV